MWMEFIQQICFFSASSFRAKSNRKKGQRKQPLNPFPHRRRVFVVDGESGTRMACSSPHCLSSPWSFLVYEVEAPYSEIKPLMPSTGRTGPLGCLWGGCYCSPLMGAVALRDGRLSFRGTHPPVGLVKMGRADPSWTQKDVGGGNPSPLLESLLLLGDTGLLF